MAALPLHLIRKMVTGGAGHRRLALVLLMVLFRARMDSQVDGNVRVSAVLDWEAPPVRSGQDAGPAGG